MDRFAALAKVCLTIGRGACGILACLSMLGGAAAAHAAPLDCPRMLASTAAKKESKETIEKAQRQLGALGYDPEGIDGILGSKTQDALKRFCTNAKFALSGELLTMLRNHSAIARAYPDWVKILASGDFAKWAESQTDAKAIADTRAEGDSAKVIAVLDRYRRQKSFVPTVRAVDDSLVSYALTDDDFKDLKSADGLLKRIGQLKGKPFANADDFDAALEAAFKGVAEPDRFIQMARKYAEPQSALMLTEKSFKALKAANVPAYVLLAIEGLQGLGYPEGEMEEALAGIFDPLGDKIMAFEPQVAKLAEIAPAGARFTAASFSRFAEAHPYDPLADAVLERLRKMEGIVYQNDKTMSKALKNVLAQEVDRMNGLMPAIMDAAQDVTSFSLSQESLAEIKEEFSKLLIPEVYLQLIDDLKGVDYPDADLLWLAVRSKVTLVPQRNGIRDLVFGRIEKRTATRLDQQMLDDMKGAVPPALIDRLSVLLGREFGDTKSLEDAVDNVFRQVADGFEKFKATILAQARKRHVFDKTQAIQWSGASCDCVRPDIAGTVYGFYPYWLAGEKQNVDFGVTTRIGYYAVGFDDKGVVSNAARWRDLQEDFIEEARRYGTKVDLVIYRNDWETWNRASIAERAAAFEQLAAGIAELLGIPLTGFSALMQPYVSLGLSPHPVRGDGVTLRFEGYPDDRDSVDLFSAFVRALAGKLRPSGREYWVNFVLRSSEIGSGIYGYDRMLGMLDDIRGSEGKLNGLFLVLLQEPTTDDKKLLRRKIEDGPHGKNRMKLLRSVAMVMSVDGHNEKQFAGDVIYANDTFGGIGFWPQPVAANGPPAEGFIARELHKDYVYSPEGSVLDAVSVCRFICPNKWLFRAALDFFALVMLASAFAYFTCCECRTRFDEHFLRFLAAAVAPFVLLGIALLACDPGWAAVSRGNGLLIALIAAVIAYAIWSYLDRKKRANLP